MRPRRWRATASQHGQYWIEGPNSQTWFKTASYVPFSSSSGTDISSPIYTSMVENFDNTDVLPSQLVLSLVNWLLLALRSRVGLT